MAEKRESKRQGNKAWKHVYGTDRAYTVRVDRLAARTAQVAQQLTEVVQEFEPSLAYEIQRRKTWTRDDLYAERLDRER